MACFILIHGAMHGGWTWDRVTPLLEAAGHQVVAPDLPGMGADPAVAAQDVTLALWGEFVADLVRAAGQPVVLAGHSRGGIVISEAAERVPELLSGLIYVTALVVPPGMVGIEAAGGTPQDDPAIVAPPMMPEIAAPAMYNRCSAADAQWAVAQLCPEPMLPLHTPMTVTWDRWGRIPRGFIACSDDRILNPALQQTMLGRVPCDPVITLDSDHSPFLCMPETLVETMIDMAKGFGAA